MENINNPPSLKLWRDKGGPMIILLLLFSLCTSAAYNITDEEMEQYRLTTTKVDLNDPHELYMRSMNVYFKDKTNSAEITRRLTPIFERRHRRSLTIVNSVSDEELAAHMSPIIIGFLDQELITKDNKIEEDKNRYKCRLVASCIGTTVSLMGIVTTLVVHFNSCL